MKKNLKFNVDSINIVQEVSDEQLAIAEVWICHNDNNLHKFPITMNALESAVPSLYNKFIVAGNDNDNDFKGHEGKKQLIVGFFPKENNVRFEEKDGKTYMVANAIISKVYAEWAYNILSENNYKEVSMEIIVLETKEIDGVDWIDSFVFLGVTILGENHTAACPGANVQITQFSTDEMIEYGEKFYQNYKTSIFEDEDIYEIPEKIKTNVANGMLLAQQISYKCDNDILSFSTLLLSKDKLNESQIKDNIDLYAKDLGNLTLLEYSLLGGKEGYEWMFEISSKLNVVLENPKDDAEDDTEDNVNTDTEEDNEVYLSINKSEILSTSEWNAESEENIKNYVIKAKNFNEVAPQIFMNLGDDWESKSKDALSLPIMEKINSELFYNKFALFNALNYAKKNKYNELIEKINSIILELGLKVEEEKTNMTKVEFAELTYRNKMEIIDKYLQDNIASRYDYFYVSDIMDDFVIIYDGEENFYFKVPYKITEDGVFVDIDNKVAVVNSWIVFAKEEEKEDEEEAKEDEEVKEEEEEEEESMSKFEVEIEEFSKKVDGLEAENTELKETIKGLQEFKANVEKEQKDNIIMSTIFDIKEKCSNIPQDELDALSENANEFSIENIEDWKNMAYSKAFVYSNGINDKKSSFTKIGLPFKGEETKKSLWD